ncbi:vacuolar protein sorting-associated protein 18 homolog [Zophobas morio]|uniref:vacuolar protein sorting-associated protein 18 homolog n=1 Tax=Zophobas morio TaxID=2755281 RepID=UPI003082B4C9
MFSKYKTSQALVFQELLSDSPTSALAVYNTFDNISPSFAWMNGLGIYYGTLSIDERQKSDFLLRNTILFLFTSENNFNAAPLSFIPTKLHFLILGGTYLAGICTLNQSVVFRRGLSTISSSRLIGLCADHERGTYWCYSADSVYEICASNEEDSLWHYYLAKGEYESALGLCLENSARTQLVRSAQARHYFDAGQYQLAAECYSHTSTPLEDVALMFLEKNALVALKEYLSKILNSLKPNLGVCPISCFGAVIVYM